MKVSDFIYQYKPNNFSHYDAICRVRIFVYETSQYALLTDLGERSGSGSVTNAVEYIRSQLIHQGFISSDTQVIEHYEDKYSGYGTFDLVEFDSNNNPRWKKVTLNKTQILLGCQIEELLDKTLKNPRLFPQIDNMYHNIQPSHSKFSTESSDIIIKRLKIEESMFMKKELVELIAINPIEHDILSFLKKDLSLFGELYGAPSEEYICFSEFKIPDGVIDFVVFSGRSRMDVTLIEIKGANFSIINESGYQNLSQKTNEAIQQVRQRVSAIYRDYEKYRKHFHSARLDVESGLRVHNVLCGPKGKLGVDKDKDINIRTVVIAGRSKNDLEESKERHNLEMSMSPPIKLESWDSFLNKLPKSRGL
ncbi:hypothetical protein CBW58_16180 [Yersinia frederiksenii]|nr:hypothetical protein CBW58_16180 [Yersinia frederiksenii]